MAVLENEESYAILVCGDSLDEACSLAVDEAVKALMCEHNWSFEEAYILQALLWIRKSVLGQLF
jgi:acetamidase/formamidase